MTPPATPTADAAARHLAEVLQAQADDLASDDLPTVAAAMTAVRAAARQVEGALRERGWGGDVLYGFGAEDEEDLEDDDHEHDDHDHDHEHDHDEEDDGPYVAPPGTRMTVQSRFDLVVVDEDALLAHVERRLAELGEPMSREEIQEHGALYVLAHHQGFGGLDLEGTGLELAGGQDTVHEIAQTLWEMDDADADDAFPTAG